MFQPCIWTQNKYHKYFLGVSKKLKLPGSLFQRRVNCCLLVILWSSYMYWQINKYILKVLVNKSEINFLETSSWNVYLNWEYVLSITPQSFEGKMRLSRFWPYVRTYLNTYVRLHLIFLKSYTANLPRTPYIFTDSGPLKNY